MDMSAVLDKYGLTLATVLSEDSLQSLVKVHADLLETLSKDSETQQNREKDIRDEIKKNTLIPEGLATEIREVLAKWMEQEPNLSIPFVDLLQEIKQDVMTFRDFHVSSLARENKPERVTDSDEVSERKDEAEALRDCIVSVFNLMGKPMVIPTKINKAGETVVDLPRIPGGNTTGNVGRGAKVRQMRFAINGSELPEGTLFYDVLQKHVNNFATGEVIKVAEFWQVVEDSNQEKYPEGKDKRWTVNVFGLDVSGWLPESK